MEKCICCCDGRSSERRPPVFVVVVVCLFAPLLLLLSFFGQTMCVVQSESSSTSIVVHKDYCEAETFKASCPSSQVVLVRNALYGRMRIGRCVFRSYGHIGCSANVLTHMDVMCSGSVSCDVRIPDTTLDRANSCPKDLKTYLEVSYDCVTVHSPECSCDNESTVLLSGRSGFISSSPNNNGSQCRFSRPCALLLKAPQGQRLNVSLWDFTLEEHERYHLKQVHGVETCYRYGVIVERSRSREVDICGGWRRVRHIYTSFGNILEIQLSGTLVKDHRPKFLLQHEAVGCVDFDAPLNSWMRHNGMSVDVGCQSGGATYRVVCVDNEWVGSIGACPEVGSGEEIKELVLDETAIASGVFISVVVCLALVTGTVILIIGLIVLHRHGIAVAVSRPAVQKQISGGNNHLASSSAGDVCGGMSSSAGHEYCYNEVTYTPSLTSPATVDLSQGVRGHLHETLQCLCQTNLSGESPPSISDYAPPSSIRLCQILNRSSGRDFSEIPTFRRSPDKSQTLAAFGAVPSPPLCPGVPSPSEASGAAAQCPAFTVNCPRFLQSAALQEYVLKYSSTTVAEDSIPRCD